MGRKPTRNLNLPRRMRARRRGDKTWYYYDTGGKPRKEIPLGCDYALAMKQWAALEIDAPPLHPDIITFRYVAERYIKEVIPTKARATQKDNLRELIWLYKFFDDPPAPLQEIKPIDIRQYLDWRKTVRANREKALFSHIYNKAREWGYTDAPNPCAGIKGKSEKGRKSVYIEDDIYNAVYNAGKPVLQDAMSLAYLTGQRPADILKMTEQDIKAGTLTITQSKTGAKIRMSIEGELILCIQKIMVRKAGHKVRSLYLVVDENGQGVTLRTLQGHFQRARFAAGIDSNSFQFRDLRGKAATDKTELSGDMRQAQKQLGHTNITTTERYIRRRRGDKVTPTK